MALSDTANSIGAMKDIVCPHCKAFKFKGETSSSCCLEGKVKLPLFPAPPKEVMDLLSPLDPNNLESRLYRQNIRSFNNALCMSSLVVNERQFSGWSPSVVFEGKVHQYIGPLETADGAQSIIPSVCLQPRCIGQKVPAKF